MMLKCTNLMDLGDNFIQILIKDCDDNPIVLPSLMENVDVSLPDGTVTKFTNVTIKGKQSDLTSGGFLVHPYICHYDTME